MWSRRNFAPRYWAARFWAKVGLTSTIVWNPTVTKVPAENRIARVASENRVVKA